MQSLLLLLQFRHTAAAETPPAAAAAVPAASAAPVAAPAVPAAAPAPSAAVAPAAPASAALAAPPASVAAPAVPVSAPTAPASGPTVLAPAVPASVAPVDVADCGVYTSPDCVGLFGMSFVSGLFSGPLAAELISLVLLPLPSSALAILSWFCFCSSIFLLAFSSAFFEASLSKSFCSFFSFSFA